jgi:predicted nucleic acid-binding protein
VKLVVDASVAAKWLVPEVLSEGAVGLLDPGNELVVPELFWAEVGNILWKKARAGELQKIEALTRFDAVASMGLRTISNQVVARRAVQVALATGRTVYDSIYIALAMHEGCRFVTADERLVKGLGGTPYREHAVWLGTM